MATQPPEFPGHPAPPSPAPTPQGPPPQQPQQWYPARPQTNGMAVAAMVLGIVGMFTFPLLMIPNILAVVFGFVGRSQIDRAPAHSMGGRGMAIAGIVLGFVGIALFALIVPFGNFEFHIGNP